MIRIFERVGGDPIRLHFYNMTTSVVQVLKDTECILTDSFNHFMLYYRFQVDFCNPASENEKGNVETKVGYCRSNAFAPVPTILSFADFIEYLWDWFEKDAQRNHYNHNVLIQDLWDEEAKSLPTLPDYPFSVFFYATLSFNKYGIMIIENNRHGLIPKLSGNKVQAKIHYDRIEFFHDHQPIGSYRRSYGSGEEIYDWTQYVTTLCKKPGAAVHTWFFHQLPILCQSHFKQTRGERPQEKNPQNCDSR